MATIRIKSRLGEKKGDSRDEVRDSRCEIRGASYRRRDFTSSNKKIMREINFTPSSERRSGFSRE